MKKITMSLLLLLFSLGMVGCSSESTNTNTNTGGSSNNEEAYDLDGEDFIIMANNPETADPRLSGYERAFKEEKIAAIAAVEEKYNCNVVYANYPSDATWGSARQQYIINQTVSGSPEAHVFEVNTYEIAILATGKGISPIGDYMDELAPEGYWEDKKMFGQFGDEYYTYDDTYSYAEEGIFFNVDLWQQIYGETAKMPDEMWLDGEWTWDKFEEVVKDLNEKLDHTAATPQYPMGGRTYNWAYQFIGSNGEHIVNADNTIGLLNEGSLEAMTFLSDLYSENGMWIDNCPLNDASQPEFETGNVMFHNGQNWWAVNKWGDREFDLGFVPYPAGPQIEDEYLVGDLSNYYQNDVYGKAAYVISAGYSKDNIPAGYENLMMHDETIFKIWSEIQVFPEIDPETGEYNVETFLDDYYATRMMDRYATVDSRDAHADIFSTAYPDKFYSLQESNNQNEEGYMIKIQSAIQTGDVRNTITSMVNSLKENLRTTFKLGDDFDFKLPTSTE